jgi:hypothetical protein
MAMDPVNPKALKDKFKDRQDKDIDNDGDVDSSDEYLHKRRSAVSKAISKVKEAVELDEISKSTAIAALRKRQSHADDFYSEPNDQSKADATRRRIQKKFGSKTAKDAERGVEIDRKGRPQDTGPTDYLDAKPDVYSNFSRPNSKKGTQQRLDYMKLNKGRFRKEAVELDEAKLSTQQRDRLDDLILNVHLTTHPEYDGEETPGKYLKDIEKEFGASVAKQVNDGIDKEHWGRDNHTYGSDKLSWRKGNARITKSGKMNAQDVKALKNRIKRDKAWGGITKKVKLPEELVVAKVLDRMSEAKLSTQQRDRLDDLILNVHLTTHPEYDGEEEPTKYLNMIRKEFGDKVAKQVNDGIDKEHWGRDNHTYGSDKLSWRKGGARITKSGKMNKQDVEALKNRIKRDKAWGGITKKVKLPEESVVAKVLDRMSEAKDGYTINHKTFSSAVQHAEEVVNKRGFEVDPEEWDHKVSMGPRKPGAGKTNSYTIALMKNGKETRRKLQMQVYYDEGRYELNMYIS